MSLPQMVDRKPHRKSLKMVLIIKTCSQKNLLTNLQRNPNNIHPSETSRFPKESCHRGPITAGTRKAYSFKSRTTILIPLYNQVLLPSRSHNNRQALCKVRFRPILSYSSCQICSKRLSPSWCRSRHNWKIIPSFFLYRCQKRSYNHLTRWVPYSLIRYIQWMKRSSVLYKIAWRWSNFWKRSPPTGIPLLKLNLTGACSHSRRDCYRNSLIRLSGPRFSCSSRFRPRRKSSVWWTNRFLTFLRLGFHTKSILCNRKCTLRTFFNRRRRRVKHRSSAYFAIR